MAPSVSGAAQAARNISPNEDPRNSLYQSLAQDLAGFSEHKIRTQFVIKVLSILSCMLMITTSVVSIITVSKSTQLFLLENWWLSLVAGILLFSVSIVLGCSEKLRKSFPLNYALLLALTLTQSILLCYIVAAYETNSVFVGIFITCIVTGAVATLSASTTYDLTQLESHLVVAVAVLAVVQLGAFVFVPSLRKIDTVFGGVAAMVFCLYIALDIHLLLGNQHNQLYPEDYIGAVITLYIDVINLFISLLHQFGKRKESNAS